MKRLLFRLIIVLIMIGAGWLIYNSDSFNCNGSKSKAWISSTDSRIQESCDKFYFVSKFLAAPIRNVH